MCDHRLLLKLCTFNLSPLINIKAPLYPPLIREQKDAGIICLRLSVPLSSKAFALQELAPF